MTEQEIKTLMTLAPKRQRMMEVGIVKWQV
jgi:hypothetical protein